MLAVSIPVFVDVLCAFYHGEAESTEKHGGFSTKNILLERHGGNFASVEFPS
jgi:hypothetical protein